MITEFIMLKERLKGRIKVDKLLMEDCCLTIVLIVNSKRMRGTVGGKT